jgi:hypothetical protein
MDVRQINSTATYKILNKRVQDQILYTEVEYSFDRGIVTVEVAHFNPQSTEEIDINLLNRAESELQKIQIIEQLEQLLPSIELNQPKDISI